MRRAALIAALCLFLSGCANRPIFGIELGTIVDRGDCIPNSATKPCN